MYRLLLLIVFSTYSSGCFSQANLRMNVNPLIAIELGYGTSESYAGLSIPLGKNQSYLSVRYLQSLSLGDSSINRTSQWYGIENSISLNKKTELIIGLGYLTDIEKGLAFDISPKVGLQTMLARNLYGGVSYVQFIPRHIKSSYQPLLTLDLKYIVFKQTSSRGLVKLKRQNKQIFAAAAFGGYYSSLGIDYYSLKQDRIGLSVRIYTNFGTLFKTESYPEWQQVAVNYRYPITKEIEITGLIGIASELRPSLTALSPLIGLNMRTLIYENIYFTVETSQTTKTLVRNRIQPIVHAGFSVLL